ncbi:MAG: ArsR/SmtB family transcription factor [Phyllobacterium sp.]
MVEHHSHYLDSVFHALSDPTRRAMLHHLSDGEQTVSELATPFNMSLAGASKHIRVLEGAGLVRRTVLGRTHMCRLDASRLAEAQSWLRYYERFWTCRLDDLDALLKAEDAAAAKKREAAKDLPDGQ